MGNVHFPKQRKFEVSTFPYSSQLHVHVYMYVIVYCLPVLQWRQWERREIQRMTSLQMVISRKDYDRLKILNVNASCDLYYVSDHVNSYAMAPLY